MNSNLKQENKITWGIFFAKYGIFLVLVFMCIIISILNEAFYQPSNLITILKQVSVIGTIALGMTMVIITGGIDLSPGSLLALIGVVVASVAHPGYPVIVPIIAGIITGAICGFINGSVISFTGIPPFIATLGMMTAARGVALLYSGGRPISDFSNEFLYIGSGSIGPIPIIVLIFLLMIIISYLLLKKTRFGKYIYAIGGNEQAARVCGLNINKIKIMVYVYMGILTGIAAIIMTSRVSAGNPSAGLSYELDAIASAVIGGASLSGGIGSIIGTLIGALTIGVLNNGLTILNVSPYWQSVIKGAIIVIAVILDSLKNKKR